MRLTVAFAKMPADAKIIERKQHGDVKDVATRGCPTTNLEDFPVLDYEYSLNTVSCEKRK